MKINREKFLFQLEAVQPGLAPREIIEQSSCFVFKAGELITFNDEISCRFKTTLQLEGAVSAAPLLAILRKLAEEDLEITVGEGELRLEGKQRSVGVRMEQEITLPVHVVESPKKWYPLADDFSEAVFIAGQCAGSDSSQFATTCIHLHSKWIEACDNFQLCRYTIATPIKTPSLIRGTALRQIVNLGMDEFSETESWIHFRNPSGLVFSCRRHLETYPDLEGFLAVQGEPTVLPKGLAEAVDKAEVFSSENADRNQIQVDLRPGKMRVTGRSTAGWYQEVKKLKYNGAPLRFLIAPKLLVEITKRHTDCEIAKEHLKVDGGRFVYVTCLEAEGAKAGSAAAVEADGE
jgi:hypothetical protein